MIRVGVVVVVAVVAVVDVVDVVNVVGVDVAGAVTEETAVVAVERGGLMVLMATIQTPVWARGSEH